MPFDTDLLDRPRPLAASAIGAADGRPLRLLCLGAHSDDIEIGAGGTVLTLLYSVHVRTRKLWTAERPLLPGSTRQPFFGFSRGRSIARHPKSEVRWVVFSADGHRADEART